MHVVTESSVRIEIYKQVVISSTLLPKLITILNSFNLSSFKHTKTFTSLPNQTSQQSKTFTMQFFSFFFFATLAAFGLAAPSEEVGRDVVQEGDELAKRVNYKMPYKGADM